MHCCTLNLLIDSSREQRLRANAKMHKEKSHCSTCFRVQVFLLYVYNVYILWEKKPTNIANEMMWQGIKLACYVLNID